MRRFIAAIAALVAMLIMLAAPAQAYDADYLNQSRRMLQDAPVFVSSVVDGYSDADIQSAKQALEGKSIALVVLPTVATTSPGDTIALATQLAQDSSYSTVGVRVGDFFAVGSRTLSAEQTTKIGSELAAEKSLTAIASKLAQQATTAPEPAAQNIPSDSPVKNNRSMVSILLLFVIVAAAVVGGLLLIKRRAHHSSELLQGKINVIADQIHKITTIRGDQDIALSATHTLKYTHDLFERLEKYADKDNKRDVETARVSYLNYLGNIESMLNSYIDAQENPKYYTRPVDGEVKEAISNFEAEVLKHVQMVTRTEGLKGFYEAVTHVQMYTPPERTLLQ